MDFGDVYGNIPKDEKGLLSGINSVSGIRHGLQNGSLPLIPGIYDPDNILAAAKNWEGLATETPSIVASFARAELIMHVPYQKMVEVLGIDQVIKINRLGSKDVQKWYGGQIVTSSNVLITHAHKDHDGQAQRLIGGYRVTWQTAGLLVGESNKGVGWWNDHRNYVKVEEGLVGGRYNKEPRTIERAYHNGDGKELSGGVNSTFYFTDHSLPGSAIGIKAERGKLLYSGDIQPGPLTDVAIDMIAKEDYDIFLWECTNPPNTWKPSAVATKEIVTNNVQRVLGNKSAIGNLVVAVVPPNGIEKLEC
jgi:mRNA degradation ribonuclease J1/J2